MIGLKLVIGLVIFCIVYAFQLHFNRSITLKVLSLSILFVIASLTYFSFETYKGWPTKERVGKGYVLDIEVADPNPALNFPGAIYVYVLPEKKILNWYQRIITYQFDYDSAPRSYYIPYSKQSARKYSEAQKKLKDGYVVEIDGDKEGDGVEGNVGSSKQIGSRNGGDAKDYDAPFLNIISPDTMIRKESSQGD